MLLISSYENDTRTDKVWYESSNVFYSEFVEDKSENKGDLTVVFKNGAAYKYKDVLITPDYVMFKHGGLDGSHGRALNTHIKPKYEFEKLEPRSVEVLLQEKAQCEADRKKEEREKTYFVSGHREITEAQFERYKAELSRVVEEVNAPKFVIGDYYGVDIMAQDFLLDVLEVDPGTVTVYHMHDTPRNVNPKVVNLVGGFENDEERDAAMTQVSGHDIAFVADHTKWSGTGQNILRRHIL